MGNNGQRCNSPKRAIVSEEYYEEFCRVAAETAKNLIIGDPKNPETKIGPMAQEKSIFDIQKQIDATVAEGGRILTGGHRIERK